MREILIRAIRDTKAAAGGWIGILFTILTTLAPIFTQASQTGLASLNWETIGYAATGFVTAISIMFLGTLFATPYRIEKERRIASEKLVAGLTEKPQIAPGLRMEIGPIYHGGIIPNQPDNATLIVCVAIRNVGSMPSVALSNSWKVFLRSKGLETRINLNLVNSTLSLSGIDGTGAAFQPSDQIFKKMDVPVVVGASTSGYLFSAVSRQMIESIQSGDVLSIQFEDVTGALVQADYEWQSTMGESLGYTPFAEFSAAPSNFGE